MMQSPSTKKVLRFINKQRRRKKMNLYKSALGVMIDKTTAIYLLVIGGYFLASLFIVNDFIMDYYDMFFHIEVQAKENFWLIVTIIPLRYVMQSFNKPGVLISTSEYQLSLLPYDKLKLWLLTAVRGSAKRAVIYLIMGLIIAIVLPISTGLIFSYVALLIIIDVLMTIPQWKLFQTHFLIKLAMLLLVSFINGIHFLINFLLDTSVVGFAFVGGLLIVNVFLSRKLFRNIHWTKVTETNDFMIWNMWLIARASETKFKRRRTYNLFQNLSYRKKPLRYDERALHHRLWQVYLGKNATLIVQLIAVLLMMLVAFQFVHKAIFYIGIALMLHIYTSALASFYKDRFEADIVQILPWNLQRYKQTFFKWAIYGAIILFIPVVSYLVAHSDVWLPIKLVFYLSTFVYLYQIKIGKSIILLSKRTVYTHVEEGLGVICLIAVWYSGVQPMISILLIGLIWLMLRYSKFFQSIT